MVSEPRVLVLKSSDFQRMAKANPLAKGDPASEKIEKQEALKELKIDNNTAKFDLWGFFLLHLSR